MDISYFPLRDKEIRIRNKGKSISWNIYNVLII